MPKVEMKFNTNKARTKRGIPAIIRDVKAFSARNAYNFARDVEAGSKRRVHVVTGNLRQSIRRERIGYGEHRVVVGADYGVYEEYGTRHRPPHPFFRPAVEEAKADFLREMRKVFKG